MKEILLLLFVLLIAGCSEENSEPVSMTGLNPEFEITYPAEQDTVRQSFKIGLNIEWPIKINIVSGSINSTSYTYEIDNAKSIEVTKLVQGVNTLKVKITDSYGNTSETKTRTFYYAP